MLAERGHSILKMGRHDQRGRVPTEGVDTCEAVVVDAADGIHVGPLVQRGALELLRSHEVDRAKDGVSVIDRLK